MPVPALGFPSMLAAVCLGCKRSEVARDNINYTRRYKYKISIQDIALSYHVPTTISRYLQMTNNILVSMGENVLLHMALLETRLIRILDASTASLVCVVCSTLILELGLVVVLAGTNLGWSLKVLKSHTTVSMPDNMAMHEPGTWVIGLESNDRPAGAHCCWVASTEKKGSVSSDWVGEVELSNHVGCEHTTTLAEESEIVAVKVHRVRGDEVVLDHKVGPRVCRTVQDDSTAVDRAVVSDVGQGGKRLEGRVTERHVDGLCA